MAGEVGTLPLQALGLSHCPALKTPPLEVVKRGHKAVMAYLKRILTGSRECKRTKLMLVGLGGAGKTSLVKALLSPDLRTQGTTDKEITDGIDIKDWSVRIPAGENHEKEVTLNYSVWDFAGQSVYYNTHQFFLSNRAIYLLLWNTRLGYEHAGLEFWLSSISCHAPKAKIFVLGTHADQVERADLPRQELRATFPQILYFANISAVTGLGVADLAQALHNVALAQSYMGELVPQIWLQLEQMLASRRRAAVLNFSQVEDWCLKLGMLDASEVREALAFLHELGSVQYFPQEFLKSRVVVNPQWLVDVMACLISVKKSVLNEGRFKREEIHLIWEAYDKELHPWLLRLTEEFDLSFALPEGGLNIVPCLLPPQEPEFQWPPLAPGFREMKMLYLFEYLPAGLFNRAQTRLCHYSDSHVIWKKGSLLRKNSHTAIIRQTKDSELLIKVQGPRPENVLFLIHDVLESLIGEFFSGVSYDVSVPCADCVRAASQDPHMFTARTVRRAGDMKAPFLQCAKNFHIVSLEALKEFLPPSRPADLERHLTCLMADIKDLRASFATKILFLHSRRDSGSKVLPVSPELMIRDLEAGGMEVRVLEEEKAGKDMGKLGSEVAAASVVVAAVSDNFCRDPFTSSIFQFLKRTGQRPVIAVVLSERAEWEKTDIGMLLASELYIDCSKVEKWGRRLEELLGRIKGRADRSSGTTNRHSKEGGVFLSYCWTNSADAVAKGTRRVDGATEGKDPREIAQWLEERNIPVWIDTSTLKEGVLFEEIAEALRSSKLFLACVSDEYLASNNCMLEYRFAVGVLKLPLLIASVGSGHRWQQSEIAMLALRAPRIDLQTNTDNGEMAQLLLRVKEHLGPVEEKALSPDRPPSRPRTVKELKTEKAMEMSNLSALQEMCELAQRKFLQQLIKVNRAIREAPSDVVSYPSPYPRLFVLDIEGSKESEKSTGRANKNRKASTKSHPLLELPTESFRLRFICESEKGWHLCGKELTIGSNPNASHSWRQQLLNMAPFLSPLYSILQHSSLSLRILEDPTWNSSPETSVLHFLKSQAQRSTEEENEGAFAAGYEALLRLAAGADAGLDRGGLCRGSLHSRRILWLCEEHLKSQARDQIPNDALDLDDIPITEAGIADSALVPDDHLLGGEEEEPHSIVQAVQSTVQERPQTRATELSRPSTANISQQASIAPTASPSGPADSSHKRKSRTCNLL